MTSYEYIKGEFRMTLGTIRLNLVLVPRDCELTIKVFILFLYLTTGSLNLCSKPMGNGEKVPVFLQKRSCRPVVNGVSKTVVSCYNQ